MKYHTIYLETVNSTNSYLKALASADKINDHTVVYSDYQDSGRGQGDNKWNSEMRKNLLFSWIVYPAFLAVSDQFRLSKAVSLGLIDVLREYGIEVKIKWPNDLMRENRKIGGVLIEHSVLGSNISYSIIGIGLNVNQIKFPEFPIPAVSIYGALGSEQDLQTLYSRAMKNLIRRYDQLTNDHQVIESEYTENLFRREEDSRFESMGKQFTGRVRGVDANGELQVEVSGILRTYAFQSIRMLIDPDRI